MRLFQNFSREFLGKLKYLTDRWYNQLQDMSQIFTISLTCCDLQIFAIWISFCSFCWENFKVSTWEGTTTSIIWHLSCLWAACTPTGSSMQVVSATFGSCLLLFPELDFIRASAVSAAFFWKIQDSHFVLFYVWIVITFRESRFLLFLKEALDHYHNIFKLPFDTSTSEFVENC